MLNEDRAASSHVPSNSLLSNPTTQRDAVWATDSVESHVLW